MTTHGKPNSEWSIDEKNALVRLYGERSWSSFRELFDEYAARGGARSVNGVMFALRQLVFAETLSIDHRWLSAGIQLARKLRLEAKAKKARDQKWQEIEGDLRAIKEPRIVDARPEGYLPVGDAAIATGYSTSWLELRARVYKEIRRIPERWASPSGKVIWRHLYHLEDAQAVAARCRARGRAPRFSRLVAAPPAPLPLPASVAKKDKVSEQKRVMALLRAGTIDDDVALELLERLKG